MFAAGLDRIREISRNALSAAGRVGNFIDALTDSVRHVGECLIWKNNKQTNSENLHVYCTVFITLSWKTLIFKVDCRVSTSQLD